MRPLLQKALDQNSNPETLEDVAEGLASGEAQIWIGGETVAVTNIEGPDVNVWLYAGRLSELAGLFRSCEAWARTFEFERIIVAQPRRGWTRLLKEFGFEPADDVPLALVL